MAWCYGFLYKLGKHKQCLSSKAYQARHNHPYIMLGVSPNLTKSMKPGNAVTQIGHTAGHIRQDTIIHIMLGTSPNLTKSMKP